ncbi:Unknown protein [Striga hermonthica]|uniref:Gag protein n=1 Tax=Striga hermonthica TaxID=68872 RepID=A0A9N7MKK2_STRHE|nr:Unknown protein [Striga hermonthica]
MTSYIKSIDGRAWLSVLTGWEPPTKEVEGVKHEKNEAEYSTGESSSANFNSKALNAIFGTVDENMFRLISTCTTAKDAWDTLQRHCEGSKSVCQTRLRLLAAKFETIRMLENENISSYTAKLMNIANECYSLGEPISNEKLVAKVMRSLPKRFNMMITVLDVSKDVTAIIFDDLVGTLKTFEMNLESWVASTKPARQPKTKRTGPESYNARHRPNDPAKSHLISPIPKSGQNRLRETRRTLPTKQPNTAENTAEHNRPLRSPPPAAANETERKQQKEKLTTVRRCRSSKTEARRPSPSTVGATATSPSALIASIFHDEARCHASSHGFSAKNVDNPSSTESYSLDEIVYPYWEKKNCDYEA